MAEKISNNLIEVKRMLHIEDGNMIYGFLNFCEKNIVNKILDRCHIEKLPDGLNTLVQEFLIEQYILNKNGVGEAQLEVSSASDNGQSVSFKSIGGVNIVSKNAEEFLDKNAKSLVKYRKMRR